MEQLFDVWFATLKVKYPFVIRQEAWSALCQFAKGYPLDDYTLVVQSFGQEMEMALQAMQHELALFQAQVDVITSSHAAEMDAIVREVKEHLQKK
jgi:hypothetical protein